MALAEVFGCFVEEPGASVCRRIVGKVGSGGELDEVVKNVIKRNLMMEKLARIMMTAGISFLTLMFIFLRPLQYL